MSKKIKVGVKVSNKPKPIISPKVKQHREAIAQLEKRLAQLEQMPNGLAANPAKNSIRTAIQQHSTAIDTLMKQTRKVTGSKKP